MKKIIVTIDGPAGSGKGRIAKYISKKWNLKHIDSGIFYREIAYKINRTDINILKKQKVRSFVIKIKELSLRNNKVLRSQEISKTSSIIATYIFVRDFVNKHQRKIVKNRTSKKGFVIDGRDIGSVVFKNADIKLFIEVDEKIRAKRRHKQLIDIGEKSIYPKILKDIKLRDRKDKSRKNSPLVIPKRAFIIDNSYSFKFTINQINKIIRKKI